MLCLKKVNFEKIKQNFAVEAKNNKLYELNCSQIKLQQSNVTRQQPFLFRGDVSNQQLDVSSVGEL